MGTEINILRPVSVRSSSPSFCATFHSFPCHQADHSYVAAGGYTMLAPRLGGETFLPDVGELAVAVFSISGLGCDNYQAAR